MYQVSHTCQDVLGWCTGGEVWSSVSLDYLNCATTRAVRGTDEFVGPPPGLGKGIDVVNKGKENYLTEH